MPVAPDTELAHADNFLYMVCGERADAESVHAFNTYMAIMTEHALNASTLTARVIASTGAGCHQALVGAISALEGPLHGGAVAKVLEQIGEAGQNSGAGEWARTRITQGARLMGFGHPIYESLDPRSEILRAVTRRVAPDVYAEAAKAEDGFKRALTALRPYRTIPTNVEYYSAVLLKAIGLPSDLFITAFACARMVGWGAHFVEQRQQQALGMVGVMHPMSEYVGNASSGTVHDCS